MAKANSTIDPKVWEHKGSGKWCLTRKGKRYYLGASENEAIDRYNRYASSIERGLAIPKLGEDPQEGTAELTVKNVTLEFLRLQQLRVDANDLSQRSLNDYAKTCRDFCNFVGDELWVQELTSEHFDGYRRDVGERRNVVSVGNEVTRVKTVFKTLYDYEKIDALPRFGRNFKRPKKNEVREHRINRGKKRFERDEIFLLLAELGMHERAMALLGINFNELLGRTSAAYLPRPFAIPKHSVITAQGQPHKIHSGRHAGGPCRVAALLNLDR